ncbi:MAG: hypothetical protein KA763_00555 [Xanthomonadales bacterium]|nr:hypothetical protein [Xanthomonadales bacterium]
MGTDIHGRLQYRYSKDSKYIDGGEIENDRNYRVFAMLAGVRNGRGFAGVRTHVPIVPISEPRGIPSDCNASGEDLQLSVYRGDAMVNGRYWLGDHSHSWLTLAEILEWPGWGGPLDRTGVLDADEFKRIEANGGTPESWCGGVSGSDVIVVSATDARRGAPHTHVRYDWAVPFSESVKTFRAWVDYIHLKHGWLLRNDPEAVRIVFGFDS